MQNHRNQNKKLSRSEFMGLVLKGLLGTYVLAILPAQLLSQKPWRARKVHRNPKPAIQLSAHPLAVKRDKKG